MPKFDKLERIKLDPLMISNLSDPSNFEFYWGKLNFLGKKEGFGIKIFLNGNFYFGTFKNDKMHGLGIYVFADKGENEENKKISLTKFINDFQYSKQFFDYQEKIISKNNNNFDENFKIQLKKFNENLNDKKLNYFLYTGEFVENEFHGTGDIYHCTNKKFSGKLCSNKIKEQVILTVALFLIFCTCKGILHSMKHFIKLLF